MAAGARMGKGPAMKVGSRRIDDGAGARACGRTLRRAAAAMLMALGVSGCASIQNMMPDPASFRLPDRSTFFPSNTTAFANTVLSSGPVGPGELVDPQGQCAGGAGTNAGGGVALEMTECQVVRTLGPPQSVEIAPQPGL